MALSELIVVPLIIGLGHSVETDHIVAVGNLVDIKGDWKREAFRGASWGLGHTISVVAAAGCLGFLKSFFGNPEEWPFEILAGIMLVTIGLIRTYRFLTQEDRQQDKKKSVFFHVGLIHGLAGSGAVAVLLTGRFGNLTEQYAFLSFFGLGTIAGMALVAIAFTRFRILNAGQLSFLTCLVAILSLTYGFKILFDQIS